MFKKSLLMFCVVVFAISITKASFYGNDDEAYIIGLRYPKSYDARTFQLGPECRNITYKIRLPFPSQEVVQFYDHKLKAIGWVPFIEPNYPESNRTWQHFIDDTLEGHPLINHLLAEWVNKDKNKVVSLGIRYISIYPNKQEIMYAKEPYPNNDIQEVTLQIRPFSILPPPTTDK